MVSSRHIALIAGLGSLALLLGAWGFQYIGGLSPCHMCIWQRWPHGIAALVGLLALITGPLVLWACAGLGLMTISSGLALFHTGVERGWWEGPNTCTSGPVDGLSPEALMDQIMSAPLVRCDDIAWTLFGLSMANFNLMLSLVLLGMWGVVLRRRA